MTELEALKAKCQEVLGVAENPDIFSNEVWLLCYELRACAADYMHALATRRFAAHVKATPSPLRRAMKDLDDLNVTETELLEALAAVRQNKGV